MRVLGFLAVGVTVALALANARAEVTEARATPECSQTSTGLVPLIDMGKRRYHGHPGGLYPGATNRPSPRYLRKGLSAAKRVRTENGPVVVLSIGMTNASSEFRAFTKLVTDDASVDPAVVLVDGAIEGWDARRIAWPLAGYWRAVGRRLTTQDVTPRDVQVVWLKEAISGEDRRFPRDAKALRANLRTIVQILARRFPKLRLIYASSRTYGGYAVTATNPEPAAYDSGFAVRWLVQDRIEGRLKGPWIGWGPYVWTDGTRGRSDGLTWTCDDVRKDGTQPSQAGAAKVARLLLDFFKSDPTTRSWFLATP